MSKKMRVHELAKELNKTSKDILDALAAKGIHDKKAVSTLSDDEVEKVRSAFKAKKSAVSQKAPAAAEKPVKKAGKRPAKKAPEAPPDKVAPKKELKPKAEKKLKIPPPEKAEVVVPVIPPEEEEDITVPDRFKKEIETEKVEKIKVKPAMQRAFDTIRKVEPRKWHDYKAVKKGGKQRHLPQVDKKPAIPTVTAPRKKSIKLQEGTSVKEFAELIGQKIPELIKKFMELGIMTTINQPVDLDAAMLVADSFGVKIEAAPPEAGDEIVEETVKTENLVPRPPVITIMGHVDHGKTSLLDAIRKTKVTETEAGGITQHIGAYMVNLKGRSIVFLDTPGHEAFTAMRARGSKVTDIVVLVVAADDGVMPQTIEAIDHAKAAGVPIVVAVNKIDKPEANVQKIKTGLADHGIISEEWGGQDIFSEVSAKKNIGIEELLEMILLQSDVLELKADPTRPARGTIIEAKLDRGRGPVATIIVQSGTLKIGDAFVAGSSFGKVRALIDDVGKRIQEAGPSVPVEVIGFNEVPQAGDVLTVIEDEKKARQIALSRQQKERLAQIARERKLKLDEVYHKIKEGGIKELNIIIKADVQGSAEAIKSALESIAHAEVKVKVIHVSVGGINESDVMLAAASNAIVIGFNVRPEMKAAQTAEREGVDIRLYNIIYDAIEDVKKALEGLLEPTLKEKILGRAEVRTTFTISKVGTVAGCYVIDGVIQRSSDGIRVVRDNIVVYDGRISTLKRFKDDVKEVQTGYECGILIENFNDIKVGDILENYIIEKIAAKI
ncbi:MAG: translation initiation factor IF-2 [bacterium]